MFICFGVASCCFVSKMKRLSKATCCGCDASSQAHLSKMCSNSFFWPPTSALFLTIAARKQHKLSLSWMQHPGLTHVGHVHDRYSSHFGTKPRPRTSFRMADCPVIASPVFLRFSVLSCRRFSRFLGYLAFLVF